jgi:hypothetical protein
MPIAANSVPASTSIAWIAAKSSERAGLILMGPWCPTDRQSGPTTMCRQALGQAACEIGLRDRTVRRARQGRADLGRAAIDGRRIGRPPLTIGVVEISG